MPSWSSNIKKTFQFIHQLLTYLRWGLNIDRHAPRGGEIGTVGFAMRALSEGGITSLEQLWASTCTDGSKQRAKFGGIRLDDEHAEVLREIIHLVESPVLSYLGPEAKLDGLSWSQSDASQAASSISAFWHTDNVGARLKVFVCLHGDGSQPTVLRKSSFQSNFLRIGSDAAIQLLRWIGLGVARDLSGQVFVKHRRGTIAVFDTDTLHRGSYESSVCKRVTFHMEFSNPAKHEALLGPIGSSSENSFRFTKRYLQSGVFLSFLDENRICGSENLMHYG